MKKTYIIPETVVRELDSQQGFLSLSEKGIAIDNSQTIDASESFAREDKGMWDAEW